MKLHFFKEHVQTEEHPDRPVSIESVDAKLQLADIFTMGLCEQKFKPLRDASMGWNLERDSPALKPLHEAVRLPKEATPRGSVMSGGAGVTSSSESANNDSSDLCTSAACRQSNSPQNGPTV